jgi:hypothetical protein
MLIALASAFLAATPLPVGDVQVDVGRFDAASFPQAAMRERRMPQHAMLTRVEDILRERRCQLPGQNHRRFDIRIPYVVLLEPDGTPTRFVVADIGCQPLEAFVGLVILELARVGDFEATGSNRPAWYASELRFTKVPPF